MICRDASFWDAVAQHDAVAPHIFMDMEERPSLSPLIENPSNLPFASENGGVIFVGLDALGLVREMHTLYRPEGWGREVALNGKAFVNEVFKTASVIVTHEQEGNWRSVPPKSHGWKSADEYCYIGMSKRLRLWILTKEAWIASPVGRKMQCQ